MAQEKLQRVSAAASPFTICDARITIASIVAIATDNTQFMEKKSTTLYLATNKSRPSHMLCMYCVRQWLRESVRNYLMSGHIHNFNHLFFNKINYAKNLLPVYVLTYPFCAAPFSHNFIEL